MTQPDTLVRTTRDTRTCSAHNTECFENATSGRLNVWSSGNLRTVEDIWEKGLGHYDLSYGTLGVQDVETSNLLEQFREVWKQTRDHDSIGYAQELKLHGRYRVQDRHEILCIST